MKYKIYSTCSILLLIAACHEGKFHYTQNKRYYVGHHKSQGVQYGIHEDKGYPLTDSNPNTFGTHYRTHYEENHQR